MNEMDNKGVKVERKLYGSSGNSQRSLEFNFIPCIPKELNEGNNGLKDSQCLAKFTTEGYQAKLEEIKKYLGRPAIIYHSNNQRLNLDSFLSDGVEKVIVSESILT
jgi:hypothetical protein